MALERDLHDLLYEHDCVIVPGWGGFLAHYRPARIDEARRLVLPPGKEVGFNRNLTRNDGLLIDHVAHQEGIAFDAARSRVEQEVASWKDRLASSGRLELARIGLFYRDTAGHLHFEPDERANFLKEAFGLRPLAAAPVARPNKAPVVVQLPGPEPTAERTGRPWMRAAAAVTVLITASAVAAYLALTQGLGSFTFGFRPEPSYRPGVGPALELHARAAAFTLPEASFGVRTLPLSEDGPVTLTVDLGAAPADTTAVDMPAARPMRLRFHVVGGCFAQPENADRLLKRLRDRGYPAQRLPRYGELHPVAFGSYADRQEAQEALAAIRRDGTPQAWLLVR